MFCNIPQTTPTSLIYKILGNHELIGKEIARNIDLTNRHHNNSTELIKINTQKQTGLKMIPAGTTRMINFLFKYENKENRIRAKEINFDIGEYLRKYNEDYINKSRKWIKTR